MVINKVPYCYSFTGLYHHNASLKRIPPLPSITFCKISSALSGTWESDCFADTTPTSWLTAMQMVYSYVFAYCRSIKIQTYMQYKYSTPHAQSETLYKYITATKSLSGISDSKKAREWGLAGLPPNYSATYEGASGKAPSSDLSQDTWSGSQRSTSITTKWLWGSEHQGFNTLYRTFLGCNNGASGYMYCNSTTSTHGSQDGWRGANTSAYGNYYIGPDYICMSMYLVYCMCNLQTGTKSWTTNWDDYDTPEVYYSS